MTVIIKKTDSPEEVKRKMDQFFEDLKAEKAKTAFDPYKYLGKGIFGGEDGLAFQKKQRDEWER